MSEQKNFILHVDEHHSIVFDLLRNIHEYIAAKQHEADEAIVVKDPTIIKERYDNILTELDEYLLNIAEQCVKQIEESKEDNYAAIMFYDDPEDKEHVGMQLEFSKEKFNEEHASHRIIKQIYESMTTEQ